MRLCVIGLGHVGLPTAKYVAESGLDLWAYDISERAVKSARGSGIRATSTWSEVPASDVYIICVSTLWRKRQPYIQPVVDVCQQIEKIARHGTLVSVESTIIPGTCRRIYEEIFKKHLNLVHVPHRYWEGDPLKRGVKQRRIIGGVNQVSLDSGLMLYRDKLEIPLHIVSNIEVAEMCKIAENAYRYVEIAFAEELNLICNELNLDFEEVREACNTKWNVQMLEARDGIKGHCLRKDTNYTLSLTKHKRLLKSAMKSDHAYRRWLSQQQSTQTSIGKESQR